MVARAHISDVAATKQKQESDRCKDGSSKTRIRELPDMMSASEGEGSHGKANIVREVA